MTGTHEKQASAAERHQAAGAPMRRARFAAWCVFVGMALTSMTFQTFHAITAGHMAWPLAGLYGVAPLAISIGVLEFAAVWGVLWAQVASYLIAGGAMYASASATGAVTQQAASAHTELVFGLILDAAALLAIAFINHGPAAAAVVEAVSRREAEFLEQIREARAAHAETARIAAETEAGLRAELTREQAAKAAAAVEAETALRATAEQAESDAQAALDGALQVAADAHQVRENALLQEIAAERHARGIAEEGASRWSQAEDGRIAAEAGRASYADQLRSAREALASARSEAEAASARADRLERKLTGPAGRSKSGAGRPGTAPRTGTAAIDGTGPDNDLELEAKALKLLATDLDMSGAELARKLGVSEGYGRKLRRRLAGDRPSEAVPDHPENRSGTAMEDRDGDRA